MKRNGKIKKNRLNVQKCDQNYVLAGKTLDNLQRDDRNTWEDVQGRKPTFKYTVVNLQRRNHIRNTNDRVRHNITNLYYGNNIKSEKKSRARKVA